MTKRRGNNEGTIRKRSDERWEARVTLDDGKKKCFYGKTRQEVARRLAEALRDKEQGMPIVGERQTIKQFLLSWLESIKPVVRPQTWVYYECFVRLHIIPVLGKTTLSKLTAQQIQLLYAKKLKEGLSSSSVHHLHATLHKALSNAVRLSLVQRNVADLVDPPRMARHDYVTLSSEDARKFLLEASTDRLEALYVLALTTGMRRGELLGLRWKDVDLDRGSLQVKQILQEVNGNLIFSEPKTDQSRRKVMLANVAVEALQRHLVKQNQERLALGPVWDDSFALVFPNTIGRPFSPGNLVQREYAPMLKKAGVPNIRFHDLRHTAATLLLEAGIHPKVVSEMLGHSHVSITLGVYSHVTPAMHRAAAAAMDIILVADEE